MPLPSFFRRKEKAPDSRPAPASDGGPVEAARLRARRRLIGAIVLLAVGVIGFPLVFETQPRPVAVDIPIVVPGATGAGHLASAPVMASTAPAPAEVVEPAPHAAASAATAPTAAATGTTPAARAAAVNPAPAPARNHLAAASEAPPRPPVPERPATPRPASPAPAEPPSTPARPAPRSDDGARALALLRGEGSATPEQSQRYVVQVGAYTDAQALREARQKVEKLGYKSYTQVITTDAGARTRVRVGPFPNHEQAAEVGAKLKRAGLPVAILGL